MPPPKLRVRRRAGKNTYGSISFGSDEEAATEVVDVSTSKLAPLPEVLPVTPPDADMLPEKLSEAETLQGKPAETGATVDRRDSATVRQEAMQPEVAKSIMDGLGTLQSNLGSLKDDYGSLRDNYGSLRDMLAFQEKLTRRILQRQDELEEALNTKLDEGVPIRFPNLNGETSGEDKSEASPQGQQEYHAWAPDGAGQAPAPLKTHKFYAEVSIKKEHHESLLHTIVESKWFEYASAAIILTHSIFIAYYVEYVATIDFNGHSNLTIINLVLTCLFLGEVVIKVLVERSEYFLGAERRWNWFDLVLILMVVLQIALMLVLTGKNKKKMKTVLKIAEMARTSRILRIFRFLKFSPTLQVIIFKIFRSTRTLSWVMVLMFMMIWVVAVCFTQGANDFLAGKQLDSSQILSTVEIGLVEHFGSVGKSMKTCFASISGGLQWSEIFSELEEVGFIYSSIFAVYIFAATFAMFNIITGIFMNDMHRADEDFEKELMEKKMEVQHLHLADMFDEMDGSGDGSISLAEFLAVADNPVIQEYLKAVGIAQEDAHMLFYLLDEDGSGEITIREFLNGSHALTTASTGMDMKVILYESRHMRGAFTAGMNHLDQDLEEIRHRVDDLSSRLSFLSPPKKAASRKNRQTEKRQTIAQAKRPIPYSVANLSRVTCKKNPVFINHMEGCTPDEPPVMSPKAKKTMIRLPSTSSDA